MIYLNTVSKSLKSFCMMNAQRRATMATASDIAGKVISLASWQHRYLCCENDGSLTANRTWVKGWEQFEVERVDEHRVAFKTHKGSYLSARDGRSSYALKTMPHRREWEEFTVEDEGGDKIALKTAHNRYLKAERKDSQWNFNVNCTAQAVGPWEKFTVADVHQPYPHGSVKFSLRNLPEQNSYPVGQKEWMCGVTSSTRILQAYHHPVTVDQMVREIGPAEIGGRSLPIGKPPRLLAEKLRRYEPSTIYEFHVTFRFIKKLLAEGKPVAALLYLGKEFNSKLEIDIPKLHWITLAGFDDRTNSLHVYDPAFGHPTSLDYKTFLNRWKWDGYKSWKEITGRSAWDNLTRSSLYFIDHICHRNSILWVDRKAPLSLTGTNINQFRRAHPHRYMPSFIGTVSGRGIHDCDENRAYGKFEAMSRQALEVGDEDLYVDYGVISKTHRVKRWTTGFLGNEHRCKYYVTGLAYRTVELL